MRATTRLIGDEFERIRDFIILHYCTSRRDDSPFWQQCAARRLPDALAQRIDMYRATGRIVQQRPELFTDLDWFWIFEGAGVMPRDYDPLVDTVDFEQVKRLMLAISQKVAADVAAAPTHDSFFAAANARLAGARKAAAAAAVRGLNIRGARLQTTGRCRAGRHQVRVHPRHRAR